MLTRRRSAVLLAAAMGALAAGPGTGAGWASDPASSPAVYAHRGGLAEAPENTMGAFRQSWDRYGDDGVWLELDLWLAADGELVVIHDTSLDRTTNCRGTVVTRTSTQLAACDAADGWNRAHPLNPWPSVEPVPTLRQVLAEGLDAGRDGSGDVDPDRVWRLMPELKGIPSDPGFDATGQAHAQAFADAVLAAGYPLDALQVQSFWPPSLDAAEDAFAAEGLDVHAALLTTSTLPGAPAGVGFLAAENVAFATARGYETVAPEQTSHDLAHPASAATVVAAAHAAGRRVVPWTVDDADRIGALAAAGVDGIITNAPAVAFCRLRSLCP